MSLKLPIATALLCLLTSCSPPAAQPRVGERMPEYATRTLDGAEADLAALRGEVVLLNVWATWCVPCRDELPALQEIHADNSSRGLQVVGVSIDAPGEAHLIRSFAEKFGVTYTIWHDDKDEIGERFNLIGVPATFLIDRDGLLRWQQLGPVDADDPILSSALQAALDDRAQS